MSPIYKREEAKESGWQQVRQALEAFEGDVVRAESGTWGGTGVDQETGLPLPKKEYFEIETTNNVATKVSEPLEMDIKPRMTFRVNSSSTSPRSFWVEKFLKSADDNKILLGEEGIQATPRPDGLKGKRVAFTKVVYGEGQFATKNFIINEVVGEATAPAPSTPVPATTSAPPSPATPYGIALTIPTPPVSTSAEDILEAVADLAVGRTEQQFRSAITLNPKFFGSPLLALVKTGAITQALIKDGKLKEVVENGVTVYRKP